jgi:hypothetical protein
MHTPEMLLAVVLMASLSFYVLFGGADYGGSVWDLPARGSRAQKQRELIYKPTKGLALSPREEHFSHRAPMARIRPSVHLAAAWTKADIGQDVVWSGGGSPPRTRDLARAFHASLTGPFPWRVYWADSLEGRHLIYPARRSCPPNI